MWLSCLNQLNLIISFIFIDYV